MLITAKQSNIRQAPRKMRLVASQVKKLGLAGSIDQLAVIDRRASLAILKGVKTALADAVNNHHLNVSDLVLKDIIVTDGPVLKRMRAVSRGRGFAINKRTCHLEVVLEAKPAAKDEAETKQVKEEK